MRHKHLNSNNTTNMAKTSKRKNSKNSKRAQQALERHTADTLGDTPAARFGAFTSS